MPAVSSALFHSKIEGGRHLQFEIIESEAYLETTAACIKTGKFSKIIEFPTIKSWKEEYRGSAASCLYQVMSRYMSSDFLKQLGEPDDLEVYVILLPILQSSGTGESRMVDELSKKHIVIPVNLKSDEESGFPPADWEAREYLVARTNMTVRYQALEMTLKNRNWRE